MVIAPLAGGDTVFPVIRPPLDSVLVHDPGITRMAETVFRSRDKDMHLAETVFCC